MAAILSKTFIFTLSVNLTFSDCKCSLHHLLMLDEKCDCLMLTENLVFRKKSFFLLLKKKKTFEENLQKFQISRPDVEKIGHLNKPKTCQQRRPESLRVFCF